MATQLLWKVPSITTAIGGGDEGKHEHNVQQGCGFGHHRQVLPLILFLLLNVLSALVRRTSGRSIPEMRMAGLEAS